MILVSSCVFFSAVKAIRLVRFQGRQGGFMSSKAQTREKDYERGLRIADRRRTMRLSQDELAHRAGIGRQALSAIENGGDFKTQRMLHSIMIRNQAFIIRMLLTKKLQQTNLYLILRIQLTNQYTVRWQPERKLPTPSIPEMMLLQSNWL